MQTPTGYEREERLYFPVGVDLHVIVVVSGYASVFFHGDPDEDVMENDEDVQLVVGPYFERIMHVSPLITVAKFIHPNSDEDDASGWGVHGCKWDAISGLDGVPTNYHRVQLTATVTALGGHNARVECLGYHLVVEGQGLININDPGPSHY